MIISENRRNDNIMLLIKCHHKHVSVLWDTSIYLFQRIREIGFVFFPTQVWEKMNIKTITKFIFFKHHSHSLFIFVFGQWAVFYKSTFKNTIICIETWKLQCPMTMPMTMARVMTIRQWQWQRSDERIGQLRMRSIELAIVSECDCLWDYRFQKRYCT